MNDNDSNYDHRIQDDDHDQEDQEQEQIDAAAAAERHEEQEQEQIDAAAAAERRLPQLISLLQKKKTFLLRTRDKMDELVEEFLGKIKDDIHDMLCDDNAIESDDYRGLDSDRDTEKEVEATIRFFPEILSRRKQVAYRDEEEQDLDAEGFYPIQYLVCFERYLVCFERGNYTIGCNLKAISFVPLVARLSKEFGQFPEEERVGLLVEGWNECNCLNFLTSTDYERNDSREHNESVDDKCCLVMKELRHMGLLRKEDIREQNLLLNCLNGQSFFGKKRSRFLVEWDPTLLIDASDNPLYYAAWDSSIQGFRAVFEYGILYYPTKEGISMLFKDFGGVNKTPFNVACNIHGREEVMNVIEATLLKFQRRSDDDDDNNSNSNNTGPYNVVDTLITAAINENIHIDCLYFLLRREPDILEKLLSSSSTMIGMFDSNDNDDDDISSSKSNTSNNNTNNREDIKDGRKRSSSSENDNSSVNDDLLIATSPKKRKR